MKTITRLFLYVAVPLLTVAVLVSTGVLTVRSCQPATDTLSVRVDSFIDTVLVWKHDTLPILKKEKVLCYVPASSAPAGSPASSAPAGSPASSAPAGFAGGPSPDSLPVVQRTYSDDSTYTAYVSGILYADWPRLDSFTVRQLTVTKTVTNTVTLQARPSRWSVGIVGGYGYGLGCRGFEPFVGLGVTYRLYPP